MTIQILKLEMINVWVDTVLVLINALLVRGGPGLIINNITANFEEVLTVELNASTEYVLMYPNSDGKNPYTVRAWSDDADKDLPILLVVRQAKQVTSWTVPQKEETTQKDKVLLFYNTSKTLCHDNMDSITDDHSDFPVRPLILSQTFIVAVSTSSADNVSLQIVLHEEMEFYLEQDQRYVEHVSPSQSRFKYFSFGRNSSDTVVIEVVSPDDVCLVVSVQDNKCPVLDTNKDIKYEGIYQTVNKKGAITISKKKYKSGFFLVFVAKPDNHDCSQENSVIPLAMKATGNLVENSIVTEVTFFITNSVTLREYQIACVGILLVLVVFGAVFTGLALLFNRFGTIAKIKSERVKVYDYIEPLTEDEINKIILSKNLTVNTFAKYPKRIKRRSFNYFSHTASVALFYSIPVIQLVFTYQRVVNFTGNQDLCYYNFMCAHPLFGFSDFNHIFSNVGYVFIGLFFVFVVIDRQRKIKITKDNGIPVHYGLFYAMGLALTIEGLLSACYHICPSQSNYQFDTSFMYVMAVLIMVKLYQNRHPDINVTAYSTFSVVGIAILIATVGILNGSLLIWVLFLVGYAGLIIVLSLKIYYLNFVMCGAKQFYRCYQNLGLCKESLVPLRKGRFVALCIANLANFSVLGTGLYVYINNVTDFGTYLLGLLLANTVLHASFYTGMKIIHKEKIPVESTLFGFLSLSFWVASSMFFLDTSTLWTVTPAESRQWNQNCIVLDFFDKHDVWHLLSAPALYFTFMYLMYLDDDLCDKPQKDIPVF